MQILKCDRCDKTIKEDNEIGVVVDIFAFNVSRGVIRPNRKILDAVNSEGRKDEYLQLVFKKDPLGECHLCRVCFEEFMKFKNPQPPDR